MRNCALKSVGLCRKDLIPHRKFSRQPIAGSQSSFHIAHEGVARMLAGEMKPTVVTSFQKRSPSSYFALAGKVVGSQGPPFFWPVHESLILCFLVDTGIRFVQRFQIILLAVLGRPSDTLIRVART